MAWSTPRIWSVGEILSASNLNTYVSSDLAFLHGDVGSIDVASGAAFSLANGGLSGAPGSTRYVGATASGPPATGVFNVGDFTVAQNGHIFVCTVSGAPGTWIDVGSNANVVTSVFGRTGAVVATGSDYVASQITNAVDKVSTATQSCAGGVVSTHSTSGVGYATGAGGSVTQVTSRTTGVTLNKITGLVSTYAGSASSPTTWYTFTVTNSTVAPSDTIVLSAAAVNSVIGDTYIVSHIGTGTFDITYFTEIANSTVYKFNFAVIKAVTS